MQSKIKHIIELSIPKVVIYTFFAIYVYLFYKASLQIGNIFGIIIAFLPLIFISAFLLLKKPTWSFVILFILNYIVMGASRYITFPSSIFMDASMALCFACVIIKSTYANINIKRCINPLLIITFIWLLFCILELLNPKEPGFNDWLTKVRGSAIYPLMMVILVSILLFKYKHLKWILITWAILTILAAFKGYWQKNHGFDSTELTWLYVGGGARTHLISTGIRYFSFFSDAGNFGSSMGFSLVVFSITAFYIKKKSLKSLFLIAALAGGYGMLISGTRGALIVPFAGYASFILLSKKLKPALSMLIMIIIALCFFNFTSIGNSNSLIRRMRTAFDMNDASFNVRLENQKKLKEHLKDLPFGAGLGFGSTPDRLSKDYEFSTIPSDSWFVRIWIQTGIVGLTLYIILIFLAIAIGGYIVLFKIKDKELLGILSALLAGVVGLTTSAYGNELLGQFPNCYLYFICLAIVFMGKYYDKELEEHEQLT